MQSLLEGGEFDERYHITAKAARAASIAEREAASDGKSIASLLLGILGITVVPVICSILAISFGRTSIGNAHKRGERSNATAVIGTILGWIGLIMPLVVGLIFSVPWWGIAAALMLTGFAAWGIYDTLRNNPR